MLMPFRAAFAAIDIAWFSPRHDTRHMPADAFRYSAPLSRLI